jgi:hypothetical protein
VVLKRLCAAALIALAIAVAGASCVTLDDRCVGVRCGDGAICVDREPAPVCVCDDQHEEDESGACVPLPEEVEDVSG